MGEDLVADYTRSQDSEEEIIVDDDGVSEDTVIIDDDDDDSENEAPEAAAAEDEIIIGGEREVDSETFGIGSMEFRVKDGASDFKTAAELGTIAIPYYILVKDQQVVDEIRNTAKEALSEETFFTGVDLVIESNC